VAAVPDDTIGVKVTVKIFRAALATPAKDTDKENDG